MWFGWVVCLCFVEYDVLIYGVGLVGLFVVVYVVFEGLCVVVIECGVIGG